MCNFNAVKAFNKFWTPCTLQKFINDISKNSTCMRADESRLTTHVEKCFTKTQISSQVTAMRGKLACKIAL